MATGLDQQFLNGELQLLDLALQLTAFGSGDRRSNDLQPSYTVNTRKQSETLKSHRAYTHRSGDTARAAQSCLAGHKDIGHILQQFQFSSALDEEA